VLSASAAASASAAVSALAHLGAAAPAATPVAGPPASSLAGVCGDEPGIACRLAWDLSHSATAASVTKVFVAGPARSVAQILFIVLIAIILRALAQRLILKVTTRAGERGELRSGRTVTPGTAAARRNPRAIALGSVLSNAAAVTIFGIATAIILGDMGVNLAPVLASAGVLGIAIGFGAQNLVQDFLAGIFMLLEDQYGVGDVIAVGDISGTVEGVSLRLTRIRDVGGVVWHVRNGTIQQAGNESQGWARAVIDFPVGYSRDIAQAREVMLATATAMWQEPEWHDVILDEPQVWGVQAISADEVLIRLIARTVPLRQWEVARELRERLKNALDEAAGRAHVHVAGAAATP
jgi:small conductance mechanosensitive channel